MVLLNILIKPVWILIENQVQNGIGHSSFGLFSTLFALTTILAVFSDFGISQYSTKQIAADTDFINEYFPVLFPLKSLLTFIFPLLIVVYGWLLHYSFQELYLLFFIAFSFALMQYVLFLRGTLQARQQFNIDAWASILDKLILIVFLAILIYTSLTLELYVYARVASVVITFGILYWVIYKYVGTINYKWKWSQFNKILKKSLPFALITILYGLNERIDIVMLERLYSKHEAGLYSAAYRWVDAVMMYLWTILPIFFARFAFTINDSQEQHKLLIFGQKIVSIPIIFICVFIFFYTDKLYWQYTNSTSEELYIMEANAQILFVNVLVHGFLAIYSTLLTSSNNEKAVSKLVAASILINVILNLIFIPEYGSKAASLNTLISALFVSVGYVILAKQKMLIQLPYIIWLKLIVAFALLYGVFYVLKDISPVWWLNTFAAGVLFICIVFLLRIVKVQELMNFRKNKN